MHQQSGLQSEGHVVLRGVLDSELADRMFDAHCRSLKTPSCIAEKYGGFFVDKYPSTHGLPEKRGLGLQGNSTVRNHQIGGRV